MARLTNEIIAVKELGNEKVYFYLRRPDNEEINKFLKSRLNTKRPGKPKDESTEARESFFDSLITKVENLEDHDGTPITHETKDRIPAHWKSDIIMKEFEENDIDIKN